jgi:hypothetical protein
MAAALRRPEPVGRTAACPGRGGGGHARYPPIARKRRPAGKPDARGGANTAARSPGALPRAHPHGTGCTGPAPAGGAVAPAPAGGAVAPAPAGGAVAPAPWCGTLCPSHRGTVGGAPAMAWSSAMREDAQTMAALATPSGACIALPALSGTARCLIPPRGSGPLLHAWRASPSLHAAIGDRTQRTSPCSPASWSPP